VQQAGLNGDTGGPQFIGTVTGRGVGVIDRKHDPRNARIDQRLRAGRRSTGVPARFEGDVGSCSMRQPVGVPYRDDLGMRPTGACVKALADDSAVNADDHAADDRIRTGRPEPAFGQLNGATHHAGVELWRAHLVSCLEHLHGTAEARQDTVDVMRARPCVKKARSPARRLPSGLSPSVPEFHRVNRPKALWTFSRVADCHRRFGITPTPERTLL
jgi:hypothetical protein